MAPDWEALMNDFAGSTNALVAEVDCTVYGDELCAPHEIEGFPTLKVRWNVALEVVHIDESHLFSSPSP